MVTSCYFEGLNLVKTFCYGVSARIVFDYEVGTVVGTTDMEASPGSFGVAPEQVTSSEVLVESVDVQERRQQCCRNNPLDGSELGRRRSSI